MQLDWWQPNERVVGAIRVDGQARNYVISIDTLQTNKGTFEVGELIPLSRHEEASLTKSQLCNSKVNISSLIASELLNINSPIIVLAADPSETYTIAESLYNSASDNFQEDEDVSLLIKLVESELGNDFPLARYLKRRIAVHSSALPDDIKYLIEDLMVSGNKLQALGCHYNHCPRDKLPCFCSHNGFLQLSILRSDAC